MAKRLTFDQRRVPGTHSDDCWGWIGAAFADGYGCAWFESRIVQASRAAYCVAHGIPLAAIKGKEVLHSCDNPPCTNPRHLTLGTHAENMRDCRIKKRGRGERVVGEEVAAEIKRRYRPGRKAGKGARQPESLRGLAREFGIAYGTVRAIVGGVTYREI